MVGSTVGGIELAELLLAYNAASPEVRAIVDIALEPYRLDVSKLDTINKEMERIKTTRNIVPILDTGVKGEGEA